MSRFLTGRKAAVLVGSIGLSACGVPAQPNVQRIATDRISFSVREPERSVKTFVLVGGRLYGFPDCIPLNLNVKLSAEAVLAKLRKPLDSVDYTSSVSSYKLSVDSVVESAGLVVLDISEAQGFEEDYLALGQVVLSLTSVKGIERVGLKRSGTLLDKVKTSGLPATGTSAAENELDLPVTKASFDPVESSLLRFYFVVNDGEGRPRLHRTNKLVLPYSSDDSLEIQANLFLSELEVGPGRGSDAALRTRTLDLGAEIDWPEDSGPLRLTVQSTFDEMNATDQALALGQILLTLELIPSFAELPPVEFYVRSAPNPVVPGSQNNNSKATVATQAVAASAFRRTKVPDGNGVSVVREVLSPRDYDSLVTRSAKEISSTTECR